MKIRDDGPRIDAMLRYLGCGRDLRDFPATANEKVALIRTASARGLIAWRRTRARYELTSFGWNALMPRRRFGVASLITSAATGGIASVVAAAVFWLPADAARPRGHASASISRMENPNMLQPARSAEICVPRYAPFPARPFIVDAVAFASEPETNELPRLDHPDLADRPAPAQPMAEPGASGAKEAPAKKSRKTAHHRRRDHGRSWAYGNSWRDRSMRYAGYYGQRGW
jgi:hypothetical protein